MTPLEGIIRARIARLGPISVADYMALCLLHPEHGYYTTRNPLGQTGDFITAPEISQMFGELLGLWLAQTWRDQGAPEAFVLAELGPGRGTLMADALRAASRVRGFTKAARLCLVEVNPALQAQQAGLLGRYGPEWFADVTALPDGPLFLVANEFFDALPVRQYIRDASGWHERLIGLQDDTLAFGLGPVLPDGAVGGLPAQEAGEAFREASPAGASLASALAGRIAKAGGVALILDYGGDGSDGDTFQALKAHRKVSPLATPGEADLTAHVDFASLRHAATGVGARMTATTPQGAFLERLGITQRAQALAVGRTGAALDALIAAHRRLTHPAEMGTLFKVAAVFPEGQPEPPGFA